MLGLEPVVHAYVIWAIRQRGRLDVEILRAIWPLAVGRVWAERTQPQTLSGPVLEVVVADAVWLSELRFQQDRIRGRLNGLLPASVKRITKLKLKVGHVAPVVRSEVSEPKQELRVPLTDEQRTEVEKISDPSLRAIVSRVVERDVGRLQSGDGQGKSGEEPK